MCFSLAGGAQLHNQEQPVGGCSVQAEDVDSSLPLKLEGVPHGRASTSDASVPYCLPLTLLCSPLSSPPLRLGSLIDTGFHRVDHVAF